MSALTTSDKAKLKEALALMDAEKKGVFSVPKHEFDINDVAAADDGEVVSLKDAGKHLKGWAPKFSPASDRVTSEAEIGSQKGEYVSKLRSVSVNEMPGDIEQFSMARLMLAKSQAHEMGFAVALKRYAPLEGKWLAAFEAKAQGDMTTGVDGGFLAPELWQARLIDLLYAQQVVTKLGVTRVPMAGRVEHMPKLVGPAGVYYSAENSALQESMAQFSQLSFTARKQSALIWLSNELIMDATPDAERVLQSHLASLMAIDQDYQVLFGSGELGTPVGLAFTPGVATYQIAGSSLAYTDVTKLIHSVETLNSEPYTMFGQTDCTGIVSAMGITEQLQNLVDSSTGRPLADFGFNTGAFRRPQDHGTVSNFLSSMFGVENWQRSAILAQTVQSNGTDFVTPPANGKTSGGLNAGVMGTGTGTYSPIMAGNWEHLIIKERQDIQFLSSNVAGTAFQNDQTGIRCIRRYDVGVSHPEAFAILTNAFEGA